MLLHLVLHIGVVKADNLALVILASLPFRTEILYWLLWNYCPYKEFLQILYIILRSLVFPSFEIGRVYQFYQMLSPGQFEGGRIVFSFVFDNLSDLLVEKGY